MFRFMINPLKAPILSLGIFFVLIQFVLFNPVVSMAAEVFKVGTEAAYPPFNYLDKSGRVAGFDIDIANAVCAKLKKKCEFVIQDWDGIIPALKVQRFDAIFSSMSITADRQKEIDFAGPYYQTPARFIAKKGMFKDDRSETLSGLKLAAQAETIHPPYLKATYPKSKIIVYELYEEGLALLLAGKVDALMGDAIGLEESFLKTERGADFAFFGGNHRDEQYHGTGIGVGIRKGNPDLKKALNQALKEIYADGIYKQINDKYFAMNLWANLR